MRRRIVAVIVILVILGIAVVGYTYVVSRTSAQQCVRPSNGFLIIASDNGYNDSADHGVPQDHWPVITVQLGQTVNIVVCNADNQAHGFQIAHYLTSSIVALMPKENHDFSFVANQAGTFQIYDPIFASTNVYTQSGELVVVA
jgi:hypothetical protein